MTPFPQLLYVLFCLFYGLRVRKLLEIAAYRDYLNAPLHHHPRSNRRIDSARYQRDHPRLTAVRKPADAGRAFGVDISMLLPHINEYLNLRAREVYMHRCALADSVPTGYRDIDGREVMNSSSGGADCEGRVWHVVLGDCDLTSSRCCALNRRIGCDCGACRCCAKYAGDHIRSVFGILAACMHEYPAPFLCNP